MRMFAQSLAVLAISAAPAQAQSLTCRFESVADLAGRGHSTGTVVRTATAAIVEHDSGSWTQTYTCPYSAFSCQGTKDGIRADVDFSYPGYMITVNHVPDVGMTVIALSHLDCS